MPLIETAAGQADILTFGPDRPAAAPTLILLHACGTGAASLTRLGTAIAEQQDCRVIALNAPGYGASRLRDGHPNGADPIAASEHLTAGLIDALALSAVTLLGHSMGGFTALMLARRRPDLIARLIVIEPMAFSLLDRPEDAAARAQDRTVAEGLLAALAEDRAEEGLARFMAFWNQRPWEALPERGRQGLVAMAGQIGREVRRVSFDETPPAIYRDLTLPVLLLAGSKSPLPARRIVARLAELLPQAGMAHIADAGHMSALTHPDAVTAAVAPALSPT